MKRIIKVLLCVLMIVTNLTASPILALEADEPKEIDINLLSYIIENDEVKITSCDESISGNVIIPDMIDGYPVTSIENYAFNVCDDLTCVTIPEGVTSIADSAFSYCDSLTNIILPSTLKKIGSSAFFSCGSLTNISIPKEVTIIETDTFYFCEALETVTFEEGSKLTNIESAAFQHCSSLKNIEIPEGVTAINNYTFLNCYNLRSIIIPKSVVTIENAAFEGCSNLYKIGCYKNSEGLAYAINNSYGYYLIDGSDEENTLSGTRVNMKWNLNKKTGSLVINCNGDMPPFENNIVPWEEYKLLIQNVEIIEGCTSISEYSFENCKYLESVIIPKSLSKIGNSAFSLCESLTSITIPKGITNIGSDAFFCCTGLQTVTFEEGSQLTSIKRNAFANCGKLTNITIPKGVINIGAYAFSSNNLVNITLPESLTYIGSCAFSGNNLTNITIPKAVTVIGSSAFIGNDKLSEIVFENPNCEIDSENVISNPECEIHGYKGSTAEKFAIENGFKFVELEQTSTVTRVSRVFGASRYETAFKTADTLKATLGVSKFETAIVANGTNFADALAGSYLAAKKSAPILMTDKNAKNITNLVNYIKANVKPGGTVYILGGYAALPNSIDKGLAGYEVKRLAGADRYETNLLILEEAEVTNEAILVATGTGFADSLSASATGLPMLLVNKELNAKQKAFLEAHKGNAKYIIGGTSAVSAKVEQQVKAYGTVKRLAGAGRYDTSVLVAKEFFSNPTSAVVAYGRNFPDGLSGGPLAYAIGGPLLLAENKQANVIVNYTKSVGINSGYVLGGSGLISDTIKDNILDSDNDPYASMGNQPKPEQDEELKPWTPEEVPATYLGNGTSRKAFATKEEAVAFAKEKLADPNSEWAEYDDYGCVQISKSGQKKLPNDPWVVHFYKY